MGPGFGAVALVVAGCGTSSTAGAATSVSSEAAASSSSVVTPSVAAGPRSAADISPCDDLTAAQIVSLGFDPATKIKTDAAGQMVAERGCRWKNRDTLIDIHATNGTVALYKTKRDVEDVSFPVIGGRSSIAFHAPGDPGGCSLITDIDGGGLVVQLGIKGEHEAAVGVGSCVVAVRVMEQVAPMLLAPR